MRQTPCEKGTLLLVILESCQYQFHQLLHVDERIISAIKLCIFLYLHSVWNQLKELLKKSNDARKNNITCSGILLT